MGILSTLFQEFACQTDTPEAFCTSSNLNSSRLSPEDLKPFRDATVLDINERLSEGRAVDKLERAFLNGDPKAMEKMEGLLRTNVEHVINKYGTSYDLGYENSDTVSREQVLTDYKDFLEQQARRKDADAVFNARDYMPGKSTPILGN